MKHNTIYCSFNLNCILDLSYPANYDNSVFRDILMEGQICTFIIGFLMQNKMRDNCNLNSQYLSAVF